MVSLLQGHSLYESKKCTPHLLRLVSRAQIACCCRDVKPENIVLEGGKAGGRVYLVDFGGVQAAAMNQDFGSTVIGVESLSLE